MVLSISPVCGFKKGLRFWLILIKYGIPKKLVNLIQSFHEDMQAGISVDDDVARSVMV